MNTPMVSSFISLAELSTAEDIVQAVSESIGVAFSSDDEPLDQLLKYLTNKSQLLVFDNFEHVVESATIVSAILRSAPDVTVVATSRSKLNVSGETVLSLGGLEVTWTDPDGVLETSGVRLFLDAAKRADTGFTLDTEDLDGLARILDLTGGMPLGIILAAAWVDMLPVAEIAAEIAKSLDFLETEMGDIPDRHRSIRAVFDYSWELLSQTERDVFTSLSVFTGGFSRDAPNKVADASIRTLATLVNKSLVAPNAAKDRYSVHELLRQYAESELKEDGERYRQIHLLHCEFYAEFLDSTFDDMFSSRQAETLEEIERDLENVRGAWRYAVEAGDAEMGQKVLAPTMILYEIRGWYPAGVSLFDDGARAFADDSGSTEERVVGAMSTAFACYFRALLG
jgi:predicted ATPase